MKKKTAVHTQQVEEEKQALMLGLHSATRGMSEYTGLSREFCAKLVMRQMVKGR